MFQKGCYNMSYEAENEKVQETFSEKNEAAEVCEEVIAKDISAGNSEEETNPQKGKKKKEKKKKTWQRELLEWIECLGVALLVVFLLTTFVGRTVQVSGPSMEPTLQDKDMLVVYHLGYTPSNGDIIVLNPKGDNKPYIKRIIAIGGQTIDFKMNIDPEDNSKYYDVYVDGKVLEEDYIADYIRTDPRSYSTEEYPMTVPEGHVYVLGDNRNHSVDSRYEATVGMVNHKDIIGKAIFRFWPLGSFGLLY